MTYDKTIEAGLDLEKNKQSLIVRYGADVYRCLEIVREYIPNCFFIELYDDHHQQWIEARVKRVKGPNLIATFEYSEMHPDNCRGLIPICFPDLEKYLLCFAMTEIIEK